MAWSICLKIMVKKMQRGVQIISIVLLFTPVVFAQKGWKQVSEGNKLFTQEKYDEANNKYQDALLEDPESPIIHFNMGDVLYKKRNYEEALKHYQKALSTDDVLLEAKTYYNIGNTLYKLGKLPESILAYKKSLELNPNDEDAKYNLEYVRAKLKEMAKKQPQTPQQQQKQKQQQQNQQQNSQQDQQKNQQQQQEQQQQQMQQDQQSEQKQAPEKQKESQPLELSKEDAERILNALQNEEQKLLKKQKAKKLRGAFRGKDW